MRKQSIACFISTVLSASIACGFPISETLFSVLMLTSLMLGMTSAVMTGIRINQRIAEDRTEIAQSAHNPSDHAAA